MGSSGSCLGAQLSGASRRHTFSEQEKAALCVSSERLQSIDKGPLNVGIITFKGLFKEYPELIPLFHMEDDWEHSHQFEHHCSIVIRTLCHFIKIADHKSKIEDIVDIMVPIFTRFQHFYEIFITHTILFLSSGKEACDDASPRKAFRAVREQLDVCIGAGPGR